MHHMTKKAAVEKYSPLHVAEGKSEADVKAAIAADEKEFSDEDVEEIYQAIANPEDSGAGGSEPGSEAEKKSSTKKGKFIVKSEFRDISNFNKMNKVGDDVSHFHPERLQTLVDVGLVEKK